MYVLDCAGSCISAMCGSGAVCELRGKDCVLSLWMVAVNRCLPSA